MLKRAYIIVLVVVFIQSTGSQVFAQDSVEGLGFKDKFTAREGDMAIIQGDWNKARAIFESLHEENESLRDINAKLGFIYENLGNTAEASYYYSHTDELKGEVYNEFFLNYGNFLFGQGKYQKALKKYEEFKKRVSSSKTLEQSQIDARIEASNKNIKKVKNPVKVTIEPLSNNINSKFTDAIPAITRNGETMIYTSRRPENKGGDKAPNGEYFEDIYMAKWNPETSEWSVGEPIEGRINTKEHDAATSISPDGKQIVIYQNVLGVTRSGDIFLSTLRDNGRWTSPKAIEEINSNFFESSACFSPDGNTIYFVSERRNGIGQGDIYYSVKEEEGWSKPVNMGASVNTPGDELGIFVHPNGKTLFFASNGRTDDTFGGYDIYRTDKQDDGSWSTPENLGYPINTHRDERHFVLTADEKKGYFTAQRDDERKDLDIYEIDFTYYNPITKETKSLPSYILLKGNVKDSKLDNKLSGTIIVETKDGGKQEVAIDEDGAFMVRLKAGQSCSVTVNKEGYLPFKKSVDLPAGKEGETVPFEYDIAMERKGKLEVIDKRLFTTQLVRFEKSSAQAEFTPEVKKELDLFIEQLKKAPSFKVELSGHTDNSGNDRVNKKLSKKRANRVAEYFKKNGIDESRLVVLGFGSDKPIADNDTEEGRAQNRRVEIRLFED